MGQLIDLPRGNAPSDSTGRGRQLPDLYTMLQAQAEGKLVGHEEFRRKRQAQAQAKVDALVREDKIFSAEREFWAYERGLERVVARMAKEIFTEKMRGREGIYHGQ